MFHKYSIVHWSWTNFLWSFSHIEVHKRRKEKTIPDLTEIYLSSENVFCYYWLSMIIFFSKVFFIFSSIFIKIKQLERLSKYSIRPSHNESTPVTFCIQISKDCSSPQIQKNCNEASSKNCFISLLWFHMNEWN